MRRLAVIPSDPIEEYLKKGFSQERLRNYYNPSLFFNEVYLLSPLEKNRSDLLGMKVVYTPAKELKKRLKDLKIDILRVYGGNWACKLACENKVKGVPVVVSVHDRRQERIYDAVKNADVVLCVSQVVKELVAKKFKHPERTWILPNRVNFEIMRPIPKIEQSKIDHQFPFKYKILFVGRLDEVKNLGTLIKSLKFLGGDYGLIVIGRGDKAIYQKIAIKEGVDKQCFFIESVINEDLSQYYSWCDCLCAPSRHEGFPNVHIEALACETIIVTSDIAPMNEFITDSENGILICDYENPSSLALNIKKACTDQSLRTYIKANARRSVEQFESTKIDRLEVDYYKRILSMKEEQLFDMSCHKEEYISSYYKTIEWIKKNTLDEQGIVVSSKQRWPYLEVIGYLIPTLMNAGEYNLAYQYADFLSYMQRPNGSFAGPDGVEYIFDSGQALRGLISASTKWDKFKPFAQKCADYIVASMHNDGRLPAHYDGAIPEAVHVFVLPALQEASEVLDNPKYKQASQLALHYYKNSPNVLNNNCLTHFLAYIIDGFIDMGEMDFVRSTVREIFKNQRSNGSIAAYPHVRWVCSVGLAQLGIIAHKLQMKEESQKALSCLIKYQNKSGGFCGSYGLGARYFPKEEISWASKFFLDLVYFNEGIHSKANNEIKRLNNAQWHNAMVDETVEQISDRIKKNNFAVWCKPLLEKTYAGDSVLELGSGTGELSVILSMYGRDVYLLDYSSKSIEYSKALFNKIGLKAQYFVADILKDFPLGENSVDWVFSSGVLEHFTDEQIVEIMRKSVMVSRKGVMSLVPNSHCLFYQSGKYSQERQGKWPYGKEIPKLSMKSYFEMASLKNIQEYSIGTYHALKFFGKRDKDIRSYLDTLNTNQLRDLNQGYLLFTCGEKNV